VLIMVEDTLISRCHRAVIRAAALHSSPAGFDLLMHPDLRACVDRYEREHQVLPGSFATLAGARRVVYTAAAGEEYGIFCLSHLHRLDWARGAADAGEAPEAGTITS